MTPSVSETEHAWWAEDITSVASTLSADPQAGLDDIEAAARLVEYGPNELDAAPTTPLWRVFVAQFANTMIVVLMIAAGITVAIGEVQDAVVIVAIVILNSIVGFVQEYRAEQAITALRDLTAPDARVVRAGARKTIAAGKLVPGDVMVLEAGDIMAADARLVEAPNLRVDESALTGESVPVDKTTEVLDEAGAVMIGERTNMVLNGTAVVYGRGRAVVVATGMSTALGRITGLLKAHESLRTPLQRRLSILGRLLAVAAVVVSAIVFFAGIARGEEASLMFLTAVSLAVAAIPEALPAVVTIGLALGARQMVAQNALIRRLPAVETLGSVTVICTDKTGTLTEGRMLVEKIWTAAGEYEVTGSGFEPSGEILAGGVVIALAEDVTLSRLLTAAALCNDADVVPPADPEGAWTVVGDPTEGALLALAAKSGFEPERLRSEYPRVGEVPFDSTRKRMSTVHQAARSPWGDGRHQRGCRGCRCSSFDTCRWRRRWTTRRTGCRQRCPHRRGIRRRRVSCPGDCGQTHRRYGTGCSLPTRGGSDRLRAGRDGRPAAIRVQRRHSRGPRGRDPADHDHRRPPCDGSGNCGSNRHARRHQGDDRRRIGTRGTRSPCRTRH